MLIGAEIGLAQLEQLPFVRASLLGFLKCLKEKKKGESLYVSRCIVMQHFFSPSLAEAAPKLERTNLLKVTALCGKGALFNQLVHFALD